MRHDFIDKYSRGDTFVHKLDARIKLVGAALLLASAVTTPGDNVPVFVLLGILPIGVCLLARVPLSHLFRKTVIVLPFLLLLGPFLLLSHKQAVTFEPDMGARTLQVSREGLALFVEVASKTLVTVLTTITLVSTTPFDGLLRGLQSMRCPRIITTLLSFMYRYVFLLVDEGERMIVARDSRAVHMRPWHWIRSMGHLASALFFRTFERGERIYCAMMSRGFTGEIRTLNVPKLVRTDVIALLVLVMYVAGVRWLGRFYG